MFYLWIDQKILHVVLGNKLLRDIPIHEKFPWDVKAKGLVVFFPFPSPVSYCFPQSLDQTSAIDVNYD